MAQVPKALYSLILKEVPEAEYNQKSNLLISDMGKEKPMFGKIIDVGHGYVTSSGIILEPKVKVGDIVAFPKIGPTRINVGGQSYFSCTELMILAIIVEE